MDHLHRLARLYGVEVEYRDYEGCLRRAGAETLLAVLRGLGAPVRGPDDALPALRERTQRRWRSACEPVAAAWQGRPAHLDLRLPAQLKAVECRLELEDGEIRRLAADPSAWPLLKSRPVEGVRFELRRLSLPPDLPLGYHRFVIEAGTLRAHALVIVAPRLAHGLSGARVWGTFMPLYALHSRRGWGAGDFTDLGGLLAWTGAQGGRLVGTLPLLAAFYDRPFAPSPYQPVSRLFWNEFYLDLDRVPEMESGTGVRRITESPESAGVLAELRADRLVDYRRGMALKRSVLEQCAQSCFNGETGRLAALRNWEAEHPATGDYARFRAATERDGPWPEWARRQRGGLLREGDYDEAVVRYHLYVQWLTELQLADLATQARDAGRMLYLDLPLGVHREGYDVWRERTAFVPGVNAGAPPDAFFTAGQDWGCPPLHPEGVREQGYRYYIATIRNHLRYAGVLRLDHVAALHRLFWVPEGLPAREGVYVHNRAEEYYAVICLESERHKAVIVGEDLGTVPGYVRTGMARHRIRRMYVLPFEFSGRPEIPLRPVRARHLATLNTHDMVPFASFWLEQGNSGAGHALRRFLARGGRLPQAPGRPAAVLRACLAHLAASRAGIVLVNLEDLWLERSPQNVPGTTDERPNWRRKARFALEEIVRLPFAARTLQEVNRLRGARQVWGRRRSERTRSKE